MRKIMGILLLSLFLGLPIKGMAWGERGHSLVAEIAFKQLDRKTRKMVLQYLDGMSIEEAANWMDAIKKDSHYNALKPLHYVNFDKGAVVKDTCCDNIIYALSNTIEKLKSYKTLSPAELKRQLCYLFHLMGDLHQPLHVGYGGDKGGNMFQIQFNGKGTNLHELFDYGIIESQNIRLKNCLNVQHYSKEGLLELNSGGVLSWARESRSYLDEIYTLNGASIPSAYIDRNAILIRTQLQKAGLRLAGILKLVFERE